jgi:chromosome segregation ATPase
MQDNSEVHRE